MTKEVQFRRGTADEHTAAGAGFTGAVAEVTVDTTNNTLRVHDGTTKGGHELVGVAATQHIINKDVVAIGLTVSGISTFDGSVNANQGLIVTWATTLDTLNVTGVSTLSDVIDISIADKIVHTGDTDTAIRFPTDDTFSIEVAGNNRFYIEPTGNIGIGTDNPNRDLDVRGYNNTTIQIENYDDSRAKLEFGNTGSTNAQIYLESGDLVFENGTGGTNDRIRIKQAGNVGIGSTIPQTTLDVGGDITLSGNVLNALGNRFLIGASSIQTLTSGTSATYTPPANLLAALVIATGAGAGGGGADGTDTGSGSAGSGGAAGGTAIRVYNSTEMGASATYTIGAGSAGGSNTGGDSTAGGATSFTPAGTGTALTANGGAAGQGTATAANTSHPATVGGSASGGDMNITGGDGDGAAAADVAEIAQGGTGGGSFWGTGGGGGMVQGAGSDPGDAGHAYGSGGGGAATHDTTTGNVGGAGAAGVIFVLEFTG